MKNPMRISGKRVRQTRLVRTDRFVVAADVEAVIPVADLSEPCFEPPVVELLRQLESHAMSGDIDWLQQLGKVYVAMESP